MKIGIIGFGSRIRHMLKELQQVDSRVELVAITDVRNEQLKAELGAAAKGIAFHDNPEDMMVDNELDGVMIGTRCSLHTDMALKVMPFRVPIYLEKPVSTTYEDLIRLYRADVEYGVPVLVSFPLRPAPIVALVKEIIDSGKLGTIEHVQAVNNVPYGGVYFQNWYRDEGTTQGLFLQKATHDFDYLNYLLGHRQPIRVSAVRSKQIFKGEKQAGLLCVDCDEKLTCLESAVLKRKKGQTPVGEYCCFAVDTGNEDSSSALIQYDSGMHVSYSQNFFARNRAEARGARLFGYKGTVEFDFYTQIVKVFMHHTDRVETHELLDMKGHFGGDQALAQNYVDMVQNGAESIAPLNAGLLSALMCLKATEAAKTNTVQRISWDSIE